MVCALFANNYYKNLWIKLFQLFKFVSKNNSVIMRLTYIGATLGATIAATIGAGKRRCNMLIISGRCKRCHQTTVLYVYSVRACTYTRFEIPIFTAAGTAI